MMKLDNILIVNTFGIGDVLFSTPLLKELRHNLPHAKIHFLCNRRNFDLLINDPDIASIIVYEKDEYRALLKGAKIEFVKAFYGLIKSIKQLKVDVAIDLTLNYQMSVILMLAGVKMRFGFNYKDRGKFLTHKIELPGFRNKHVVEHYLELLKYLKLNIAAEQRLWSYTSSQDKLRVDHILEEKSLRGKILVGIAAGGGKSWGADCAYRRWDKDNFAYVGKKLADLENVHVLIFGTDEEREACQYLLEKIGDKAISFCGNTNLSLLVEFVSRCSLFICNEGGPLHIATSQDVKTISIFGPVDDRVYGPYPPCEKNIVIKADHVECRPCYRNFKHDICDDRACLKEIDRDRVAGIAIRSLGL